jgi:ribosomal protein S8
MPKVPKGKKGIYILLDEEVYKKLWEHIKESYSGSTYGLLSLEIQNAIVHWLNEKKFSTHTKTHINPGRPRSQQKIDQIIRWLKENGFINQFSYKDWILACSSTVGSDERTINKYLNLALRFNRIKHIVGSVYEIV